MTGMRVRVALVSVMAVASVAIVVGARRARASFRVVRAENAQLAAALEVVRADEQRIARVAHEFANPLTAIVGYADLLLDDDLPPRSWERVATIEEAARRLQRLIGRLVDAGGNTAPIAADLDPIDVRALLVTTVRAFGPAAAAHDVALTLHDGPVVRVAADARRLRHAFDNLIGNAVKYTPRGGAVDIAVRVEGSGAVVTIADTGIGIEAGDLARVFDDYYRADTAHAAGLPGTGLGLGIARTIIHQHGGALTLQSEPGAGSTVTVRLPRRVDDEATP